MKKILFAAFPAILLFSGWLIPADPLPIGASLPHPEVKMKDISGQEVSFSDARKKNGLLVILFRVLLVPLNLRPSTLRVGRYQDCDNDHSWHLNALINWDTS